jgi:hypothetical protein
MNWFEKLAAVFLFATIFLVCGYSIRHFEFPPYPQIVEFREFLAGDEMDADTSMTQKFWNDLGMHPFRLFQKYPDKATEGATRLSIPSAKERRADPLIYISADHGAGYRAVFGAVDLTDSLWGGLLLDPEGEIVHTWSLSTAHMPTATEGEELLNMYGLHLFPDGAVIFNQQEESGGIVKVDACSNVVWSLPGNFHHTVSATDDGFVWTYEGLQSDFDHKLAKVSIDTGEIVTVINMADVRKANPFIQIFDLQVNKTDPHISHGNDIEPLNAELADDFEQFSKGDLLLSYRSHNLVFVLDPLTLEIKWWRVGEWGRQHDPDWEAGGIISVFSNNKKNQSLREFSDIISINPVTYAAEVIVDGEEYGFYAHSNGDHELTPYGTRMVSSTTQGWAFELDAQGEIVFSFLNLYDAEQARSLNISEAVRLPESYFATDFWNQCD